MYNQKYIKYKTKYNELKDLLYGGNDIELHGEAKNEYLTRTYNLMSNVVTDEECFKLLKKNILDLFNIAIKKLESYHKSQTEQLYDEMHPKLQRIMDVDISKPNISMVNVISLQCIIFFTEILRKLYPGKRTDMSNYRPIFNLPLVYKELTDIEWDSYDDIYKFIISSYNLRNIALTNTFTDKWETINCSNLKNQMIFVVLGELSLLEILNSLANNIFLVGITTNMEWADGSYYTPFEFMHHDTVHAMNALDVRIQTRLSDIFIRHLILNQKQYEQAVFDKIILILFLILHENLHPQPDIELNRPIIEATGKGIFDSISFSLENWTNINFFGGLLPDKIFENPNEIKPYLIDASTTFKNAWEKYFITKEGIDSIGKFTEKELSYQKMEQKQNEESSEKHRLIEIIRLKEEELRLREEEISAKEEEVRLKLFLQLPNYTQLPIDKQFKIGDIVSFKSNEYKLPLDKRFTISNYQIVNNNVRYYVDSLKFPINPYHLVSIDDKIKQLTHQLQVLKQGEPQVDVKQSPIFIFNIGDIAYLTNIKNSPTFNGNRVTIIGINHTNGKYKIKHNNNNVEVFPTKLTKYPPSTINIASNIIPKPDDVPSNIISENISDINYIITN
jgi:hypothetical protein